MTIREINFVATIEPQICWYVGNNKASSTGWEKLDNYDIWYKSKQKE